MKYLTQAELSTLLYCLESMQSDFRDGEAGSADFESLFAKFESLAGQTGDPDDLDTDVLSVHLLEASYV